jgi:hypothetical protein
MSKRTDNPCKSWLCKAWNKPWNPLGNHMEPLPTPAKRRVQAEESPLPDAVWWQMRNPLTNLTHFWLGIVPVGEDGEFRRPEENGWTRVIVDENYSYWERDGKKLPYKRGTIGPFEYYAGWSSRGNFGLAFRRQQ